ncbi:Centromere protein 3 [Purpureocillium lavendulum]|uniref:Centromere protein 3 n=1 Tax=Purpureocillium lavendulum TaxID=1247861 RepID=A0AB34FKY8_9HYPO|nr:Centromere protein 3 [Purpureocillium lavendulum]
MNRFRTKKKNKDEIATGRPSIESEPSGPFRMFGRKKSQEDAKKELDLASALPPTDDFRTSLLMTGLSARFSMLREQDDPNSKLGKASDDSVLFPKRQSRLADFGLGAGLHDIAEVESIKAPPFSRFDSYNSSDDAASTSGSIMNRGKPTDGNNLFGGRQKIYKIPAGGSGKNGGMGGRALYGDDVAHSAFQKWRQSERERHSLEENEISDTIESETQADFSRRRETNSTTSSAPSAARNSTAATSVASSQPSSSVKDYSSTNAAMGNASQVPVLERSVTRTRRLYEQGLNQDLQDQQSSAVSRMDTLSRQRPFGTRTPDLTPPIPSPTNTTFGDRVLERRPIMSKASAPNLRSFSPPASSTPLSPAESGNKFPRPEQKPAFVGSPPLSPPISEAGEHPTLPIQPNDRGKATAMGVFTRPAQKYDDYKYAQRQRQLQQGRETPTGRWATDAAMPTQAARSRSSSSHRQPMDRDGLPARVPEPVAEAEAPNPTFFDESDDASIDNRSSLPSTTPQLIIERPDDEAHPAFRKSALPTPLSLTSPRFPDSVTGPSDTDDTLDHGVDPPEDSPTLGPNSGLSGMVRQHLRHDSSASSIYGAIEQQPTSESRNQPQSRSSGGSQTSKMSTETPALQDSAAATHVTPEEQDDFARHLADGARRVRERLTTYVESDNERSTPTSPLPESKELPVPRSGGLGMLRSKSSRGSLFDRESRERSRSKSSKSRMTDSSNRTVSPSPRKPSGETNEEIQQDNHGPSDDRPIDKGSPVAEKDDQVHAGLKAFRQARRELQRMKEIETQQRHQVTQKPTSMPERPPPHRIVSHDNGPPPVMFNRLPRDESRSSSRSRAGSRAASERERSGSETSTSSPAYARATRLRNGSVTYEEQFGHGGPGGFVRQGPMHNTVPGDPSGRRGGRMREVSDPKIGSPVNLGMNAHFESLPYARSRSGSVLGATASTPNLHAVANAPPLPPINPRRKNGQGFGHRGDEGVAGYGGAVSDEEGGQGMYRHAGHRTATDANGRLRQSPPRGPPSVRPPFPPTNMSSGNLPGGMI